MKEQKEQEKKEAKAAKAAAKSAAEPKAKAKARGRGKKATGEEGDEEKDEAKEEENVEAVDEKPKTRQRKRKGAAEDDEQAVAEPQAKKRAAPKAKSEPKAPRSKAKAKAKAAACVPGDVSSGGGPEETEKSEEPKEVKKPATKRAPKRKAKAADHEEEEEIKTPKKKLFGSEDERAADPGHDRLDSKTGEVKPLQQIFEEDKVKDWAKGRPKKDDPSAASAPSKPEPAKRGRGKKKQELSPFAKKQAKRRQKIDEETMREELKENIQMQGVFLQHLKDTEKFDFDGIKDHLLTMCPKDNKKSILDPYWGRGACGVKSKELPGKLPQVSYIGKFGTASSKNVNMVLCYVSAFLLVSWSKWFVCLCLCIFLAKGLTFLSAIGARMHVQQ